MQPSKTCHSSSKLTCAMQLHQEQLVIGESCHALPYLPAYGNAFLSQTFSAITICLEWGTLLNIMSLVQIYFKYESAVNCHTEFQCQFPGKPLPSELTCDFYLWGNLRDKVYKRNLHTLIEPRNNIQCNIPTIYSEEFQRVNDNSFCKYTEWIPPGEQHFPHLPKQWRVFITLSKCYHHFNTSCNYRNRNVA